MSRMQCPEGLKRPARRYLRTPVEGLESRVLLSTFSNADLNGSLTLRSMGASGIAVTDGNGNFVGGSVTDDQGIVSTPSGSYAVAANGAFSIPGSAMITGAVNSSKNVVAFSGQSENSLGVFINSGSAVFSDADLDGTWYLFDNGDSGPPDNFPTSDADNTGHATVIFDGQGGFTYTHSDDESGNSETGTGTYTVSPDGSVSVVVTTSSGNGNNLPSFSGEMNSSKDVVGMDLADLPAAASTDDSRLVVMVQPSGLYSDADVQGAWTLSTDSGQGTLTFDGAGNISGSMTSYNSGNGSMVGVVTGTYSVSPDGSFTAMPITTYPDQTNTVSVSGWINASRNVIFAGQPASGAQGLDDLGILINSNTALASKVSLASSSPEISPGQSLTLTVTVSPTRLSNNSPTGTVDFLDGTTMIGSAPVQPDGTTSFTASGLAGGMHSITASYSGDAAFAAATSTSVNVLVFMAQSIGQLDSAFGTSGLSSHDTGFVTTDGLAQDGTQSVLIGTIGTSPTESFGITRFNADGSVDTSFGTGGVAATSFGGTDDVPTAVAVLPGGQILVAGTATTLTNGATTGSEFAITEFNTDGSIDTSFGGGTGEVLISFSTTAGILSNNILKAMSISAGGVIYIGGSSGNSFAIAALTAQGALDSGFGSGGKVLDDFSSGNDVINSLALQTNGEIVAAGSATVGGVTEIALARFLSSGAIDTHFGTKGLVTTSVRGVYDSASSVVIQPKGQIVIGGSSATGTGSSLSSDFLLARYTSTGRLDRSFGGGPVITSFGQPSAVTQLVLQSNGEIVASGKTAPSLTGITPDQLNVAVARYTISGKLDTSFNGTGKTVINLGAGVISTVNSRVVTIITPLDTSGDQAMLNQLINASQGVVATTPGGEILDAGSSGSNTVEAEILTSGVNLVTSLLTAPPTAVTGGTKGAASVQLAESGTNLAAGTVTVELEIATDAVGDGATTVTSVPEKINLRQKQSRSYRIAFEYPQSLAAGSYYLVAVVQNGSSPGLADLDPANELSPSKTAVKIAPPLISLVGSALSQGSAVSAGKTAVAVLTITNDGNVLARGAITAELILSVDQTAADRTTAADVALPADLAANKGRIYRVSFKVSSTLMTGTYYLIAVIDPVNSLGATDQSDSVVVDPKAVTVG